MELEDRKLARMSAVYLCTDKQEEEQLLPTQALFHRIVAVPLIITVIGEVIDEIAEAMFKKFPSGSGTVEVKGKFDC